MNAEPRSNLREVADIERLVVAFYRDAAVDELLATRATPPSAICALNDRAGLGVYDALRRRDLRVGADVAVISFDGSDLAGWLDPPLSSLALPYVTMGERAVELLLHPTGTQTLATGLWQYTTVSDYGRSAPYAAALVLFAAVPTAILGRWSGRAGEIRGH